MKNTIFSILILLGINISHSQSWKGYKEYYPIHTKPSIGYMSSMNSTEGIVFDAKPFVYYSFWNNMRSRITDSLYKPGNTIYFLFQPHLRMYDEKSLPVKMPTYRAALGWQILKERRSNNDFYVLGFESGHYSNGQSGCAFATGITDETSACNNVLASITPQSNLSLLLNRDNGNFSTNWSKVSFNYRINKTKEGGKPRIAHSISAAYELYHNKLLGLFNIGGYSDFDIKIYGRHRFNIGYEFIHTYSAKTRYSFEVKGEYISNPHNFIKRFRGEALVVWYPGNLDFGIYATYVSGHDNYNYRFVDSGNQISFGFIWDLFAPISREHAKVLKKRENQSKS